ncbi:unnamed protein product [Calypogeia fissa]
MPTRWSDLFSFFKSAFKMSTNAPTTTTTSTTSSSSTSTSASSPKSTETQDIITNLANLLPTGTFLAFQAIAPLFTNNGNCGLVEKILTGILIGFFSAIVVILSFTDSLTTTSGKHYYGLVTYKGLWNPQFNGTNFTNGSNFYKPGGSQRRYTVTVFDFINAILGVAVFGALAVLTPPVSTCYYANISSTVVKAVPILVGIIASLYFSFAPPPRRGVGFSVAGLVTEPADDLNPKVNDGPTGTGGTGATPGTGGTGGTGGTQTTAPSTTTPATTGSKTTGPATTTTTSRGVQLTGGAKNGNNTAKPSLLTTQDKGNHSASPERMSTAV